jgi:hypothetical protein
LHLPSQEADTDVTVTVVGAFVGAFVKTGGFVPETVPAEHLIPDMRPGL